MSTLQAGNIEMMPIMRDLNARRDQLEERADFIKCAAAIMINHSKSEAAAMAKAVNLSPRIQEVLTKAAQAGATTSGVGVSNFGALIGSFMLSVKNIGAFDTIAGFALPMPM